MSPIITIFCLYACDLTSCATVYIADLKKRLLYSGHIRRICVIDYSAEARKLFKEDSCDYYGEFIMDNGKFVAVGIDINHNKKSVPLEEVTLGARRKRG